MQSTLLRVVIVLGLMGLCVTALTAQNKKKRRKIDRVIQEARAYQGTPYQWGGLNKKGIDCSGLIYNCYKTIDVELPRTAKDQSKIGSSKNWDNIRPGDIVYFKFKKRGEKWFHSGVIIRADKENIRFIHASTSRGVVEDDLLSDYYKNNVKKFRRVIK